MPPSARVSRGQSKTHEKKEKTKKIKTVKSLALAVCLSHTLRFKLRSNYQQPYTQEHGHSWPCPLSMVLHAKVPTLHGPLRPSDSINPPSPSLHTPDQPIHGTAYLGMHYPTGINQSTDVLVTGAPTFPSPSTTLIRGHAASAQIQTPQIANPSIWIIYTWLQLRTNHNLAFFPPLTPLTSSSFSRKSGYVNSAPGPVLGTCHAPPSTTRISPLT